MTNFLKLAALLLALTAVLSLCACGETKSASSHDGYVLASGDNVDYYFYVPDTWKLDKSTLFTSAYYSSGDATSISVTAYGLSKDLSLDTWWEGFAEEFKQAYQDTNIDEATKEEANLGGQDGYKYTFKGSIGGKEYDYIMIAAVRGTYVYYMTYTSTPDYYEDHLEELETVISYFEYK